MAKDKIVLAELDVDSAKLVKSMQEMRKQIEDVEKQQSKLIAKGKEASAQFITNEAEIKKLEIAYKAQLAVLTEQTNAEGKIISQKKAVKQAIKEVNNTENDYIKNNQVLLQLKKELNINDENYEKKLSNINAKLLENTNWLKENGSAHTKLVTTMNDYKEQVTDSFNQINIFNGGLSGFISRAQEAGGIGPLVSGAFQGMALGIGGMTKAALAFIATPLGAIIAAIAAVITPIIAAFKTVKPLMDKVEQAGAALSAVFDVLKNVFTGLFNPMESLGNLFSGLGTKMKNAANDAAELKKAQQELEDSMQSQEVQSERNRSEIEKLKIQSKDLTKTEEERINFLKKAEEKEKEDFDARKKNSDEALRQAQEAIKIKAGLNEDEFIQLKLQGLEYKKYVERKAGDADELFKTLAEVQKKSIALDDEYNQQLEKNITQQNKLLENKAASDSKRAADAQAEREKNDRDKKQKEKDALEKQKQVLLDAAQTQKLALDLYISQQGIKAKSMDEELKQAEYVADQKMKIAKAEFDVIEKTEKDKTKVEHARTQLQIKNNEITNELMKKRVDATVENINREMAEYKKNNQTLLDDKRFLSQELFQAELDRIDNLAVKEQEAAFQKKLAGAINQQEYIDELNRINDENYEARTQLQADRDEAEKAKQAIDLENKRVLQGEMFDVDLEEQLRQFDIKTAEERKAAVEAGADMLLFDKMKAEERKKIETNVAKNKIDLAANTIDGIFALMGKESQAGKAAAIAKTTIDTYQSAVAAYKGMATAIPGPVGIAAGVAAAAASVGFGLSNVKKIMATKAPKAEKGALFNIGGNRHSAGGTLFQGADGTTFEAEQGELIGVMNRNAARHFMAFNNAFPAGGGKAPNYFAGGGIVSREIAPASMNTDELAAKIAEANRSIPAPVVAVQDIVTEGNSYVKVRESANF